MILEQEITILLVQIAVEVFYGTFGLCLASKFSSINGRLQLGTSPSYYSMFGCYMECSVLNHYIPLRKVM